MKYAAISYQHVLEKNCDKNKINIPPDYTGKVVSAYKNGELIKEVYYDENNLLNDPSIDTMAWKIYNIDGSIKVAYSYYHGEGLTEIPAQKG